MSQRHLHTELISLVCEIQSDKINSRVKALTRLDDLFNRRLDELKGLCNDQDDAEINWTQLFECAFIGILRHVDRISSSAKTAQATENKNPLHSLIVQKIVRFANEDRPQIEANLILEKCFRILEHDFERGHFGLCFLQIIEKNILIDNTDLTSINNTNWNRLLAVLYAIYFGDSKFRNLTVSQCIYNTTRLGLMYSYVIETIDSYLKQVEEVILELNMGAQRNEWIKIAYLYCKSICFNNHTLVQNCITNIYPQIVRSYESNLPEEMKNILFEFGSLTLVLSNCDKKGVIQDSFHKILRQLNVMVEQELKFLNGQNLKFVRNPELSEIFIKFASNVCYYLFWDSPAPSTSIDDETNESRAKRPKRSHQLQAFLDHFMFDSEEFNWRWIAIFSEFLSKYPNAIENNQIKEILEIVTKYQAIIQYPIQIVSITNCCRFLIDRENKIRANQSKSEITLLNDLTGLWEKLSLAVYRATITNTENLLEYHDLLTILIQNKKFISPAFVQTALSDFSSKLFSKNSKTLKTLAALLEILDIDLIENSKKLVEDCLTWLHHKVDIVKESLKTEKDDIREEINRITVMFCIAGKGRLRLQEDTNSNVVDNLNWSKKLEKIISLKMLNQIITNDLSTSHDGNRELTMELSTLIRCVINEPTLEYVIVLLKFNQEFSNNDRCADTTFLLTHIEMLLDMINYMIRYGAVNKDSFDKMYFLKKLNILLQLVEKFFEDDQNAKFDSKKMLKTLNALNNIFSNKYHPKIGKMLRNYSFINLFKWIIQQLKHTLEDSKKIELIKDSSQLQNAHSIIRYKCFHLLAIYCQYNGNHTEHIFDFLEMMKFNLANNVDLYIVFDFIEITCQTESLEFKANWVIDKMRDLCQMYARYHCDQAISEKIINLIPRLINFCAPFSCLTDDIFTIVFSFVKKCSQKAYSPVLAEKIIYSIKYLIKSHKDLLESTKFQLIIKNFVTFIQSSILPIQLEAVDCLGYVFNQNWLLESELETDLTNFYRFLFNILPIASERMDETDDNEFENTTSVRVQLLVAIISVNYYLRKDCLFQLLEVFYKQNVGMAKIKHILTLCCKALDIKVNELIEVNFEFVLSKWLTNNYLMGKFPWFLTECESQSNFFIHFKEIISFGVLRYKCDLLEDFAKIISIDVRDLIKPILPWCIALLIPYYSNCLTTIDHYKTNSITLERKLMEYFTADEIDLTFKENMIEIIQILLLNYSDESVFQTLFQFEIKFVKEEFSIDKPTFHQCLQYLQTKSMKPDQLNIILNYCAKRPLEILHLLNFIKLKLQNSTITEDKLLYLMQYCVLMEYVEIYLKTQIIVENLKNQDQLTSIKEMFIRDFIYFISNLVLLENQKYVQLNIASVRYLQKFLSSVLLNQKCLIYFRNIFAHIITTLTTLVRTNRNAIVTETCHEILKMVILNNYELLKELIEQIDEFPNESNFNELNSIIKRKRVIITSNSLANEVDGFIKNTNIKHESLVRLKEKLESKVELKELYKTLHENSDYSEDCENSVIHQLIFKLFKIVQGNDMVKSIEAAKCLGELGISDLTTILLKSNPQSNFHEPAKTYDEAVENFIHASFEKLDLYLSHPDVRVVRCALDTCNHLSFTKAAQRLIDQFPYLHIFIYRINTASIKLEIFSNQNNIALKIDNFFRNDVESHTLWIKELAFTLLNLLGNSMLADICKLQLSYCERVLPILIQILLFMKNKNYASVVKNFLAMFFKRHAKYLQENEENHEVIYLNKKSLGIILNVVECVRLYNQAMDLDQDRVEVNYLECAKAALYCKSFFTAILYCELHALNAGSSSDELKTVMRKAYTLIGDADSASVFVDPINSRLEYLSLKNSLHNITLNYDAAHNLPHEMSSFKSSLLKSGYYYLASLVPHKSETDFETYWRMADWNISTSGHSTENDSPNFEENHYRALKCLNNRDELEMFSSLDSARLSVINSIKLSSLECTKNLYDNLLKLQMLQQIIDFSKFQFNERSDENCKKIIDKWNVQDLIPVNNFQLQEKILSQRYSIYSTLGIRGMRTLSKFKPEPIQNILLKIIQESRENGNINLAIRNLAKLCEMENGMNIRGLLIIEDSQLQWLNGDKNLSKLLLKNLLTESGFNVTLNKIIALRLFGEYLTESESENPIIIYRDYFNASLKLLEKFTNKKDDFLKIHRDITEEYFNEFESRNKIDIYNAIAKYADKVYVQKIMYIKSPEYQCKKQCIEKNKQTIKDLMPKAEKGLITTDERKLWQMLKKNILIDVSEIKNVEKERDDYLILSLSNYIKSAKISPSPNDLSIFRIASLWLSNKNNTNVMKVVTNDLLNIPSHKFLIAISQISAHLTDTSDRCGALIYNLLEKCSLDHPHHTLNHICSIANSYADSPVPNATSSDPRVKTSKQLLTKLKENSKIGMIINQMELMNSSLIKLANENLEIVGSSGANHLKRLKLLDAVQCPTVNLEISFDCKYDKLTSIINWDTHIEKVSGINAPKKILCACSDGKSRPQLLKGKDDLRQDAVMQQVFTILNKLLSSNKETNRRKLHVRTYKIVPLSQRSGILEWCENTIPIGTYLTGVSSRKSGGAHKKYRPNDMSVMECRELMTKFREKTNEEKLENFQRICEKLKPVFQHFFLELYQCPAVWFKRRLAYVNSVATNSMIGYILGLGDRHVQNILIDQKTAEVIHIDFGIAFEQGKILPTPETIPFRLSRDIIAPMGVCGVDGQFRSSSEKVMDIMRNHKLTIITILEVLLYDPLYSWKLTNKKAYSKQVIVDDMDQADSNAFENDVVMAEDETNTTAERALMRLQEKLRGEEIGATGMSTVEAQVERLIQQATDPCNLSRLFPGWQPYL